MRWSYWLLAIAGILQYTVMAAYRPAGYVSLDMAYLVMWLTIIGACVGCWMSCGGYCGYGGYGGGCGCCGDDCECGDCSDCRPDGEGMHEHGHEGHDHGPGEHSH